MFRRNMVPVVLEALAESPVVFLQGARQVGKSTLVQALAPAGHGAAYLTLDDATLLASIRDDPQGLIDGLDGAVILDEIQRAPQAFLAIKRSVDADRRPGRFLLTGSAGVMVLPQLAEALVGRVEVLTLHPLSQGEVEGRMESFVDALFAKRLPSLPAEPIAWSEIAAMLARGGFPEAHSRRTDARRAAWFGSYVTTILQRDVRDLASIEQLAAMPRLLTLLAARTASLLNYAELARSAALAQTTLKRYMALLEGTFLVQLVQPWLSNLGKRLVKSPKVLLCDTGLAAALLGADAPRLVADRALAGRLLETLVALELSKQAGWSETRPQLLHYRTHAQREVDVVLEAPSGEVVGVEVKAAGSVRADDLKGLEDLAEAAGDRFVRGVVLYCGDRTVPFGSRFHAVPLAALWQTPARRRG